MRWFLGKNGIELKSRKQLALFKPALVDVEVETINLKRVFDKISKRKTTKDLKSLSLDLIYNTSLLASTLNAFERELIKEEANELFKEISLFTAHNINIVVFALMSENCDFNSVLKEYKDKLSNEKCDYFHTFYAEEGDCRVWCNNIVRSLTALVREFGMFDNMTTIMRNSLEEHLVLLLLLRRSLGLKPDTLHLTT